MRHLSYVLVITCQSCHFCPVHEYLANVLSLFTRHPWHIHPPDMPNLSDMPPLPDILRSEELLKETEDLCNAVQEKTSNHIMLGLTKNNV